MALNNQQWLIFHKTKTNKQTNNLSIYLCSWCPRGVVVKGMDCRIIISKFEFQLRYYVHFRTNTLGKDMNPLSIVPLLFFYKDGLGFK